MFLVVLCAGSTVLLVQSKALDEAPYKLPRAVAKIAGITFLSLAFSYWFDKPRFLTEGKLATILIIPSSWGSQLGGYLPASSNFFWRHCRGKRRFLQGLNFSSRNLLNSAAGGTFMSLTWGSITKLLDNMMVNYSEWHTERAPQGKKVNSVEETCSLSDKIDAIMLMLSNDRAHDDPNNVPLASLVAQEEHVVVNFIRNNNFNNNAYRNNFASNNYRPYPPTNGNGYGNSYGNSSNNTRAAPSELEVLLKDFIGKKTAFNKSVEEKLDKIDVLASKVDSLALDVELL
jgi:hypothetical protein